MILSREAVRLLRWMRRNDEWKYRDELEKKCKYFSYRSFTALRTKKLIDACVFEDEVPDCDEYGGTFYPEHYRINDAGHAYLETVSVNWIPELREWIAIGISVIALIVSIIALISGLAQ